MVSSIKRFHCIQDSQQGPSGVLYKEVPVYTSMNGSETQVVRVCGHTRSGARLCEREDLTHH